jgi:alkylated DNA repair dioxygenase AlkB
VGSPAPLPLSLFATGEPALGGDALVERTPLDDECWVDVARTWVHGGDELLERLVDSLNWRHGQRVMWGNLVDEPRLTTPLQLRGPSTPAVVGDMAAALSDHYGVRFDSCFVNYYRGGSDSVAWHGDRVGRTVPRPFVAIVSLGGPRTQMLRPKGGGKSRRFPLYSGDLLVMGGATQHRWEHSVPKVRHAPPRLSVTFRHSDSLPDESE